ncbi:MAG: ATP-binding protein [Sulfuricellaceae bacterium]
MKAFFGSMGGRVFLILVGGIFAAAALTQFLASNERRELFSSVRIQHTAERVEQFVFMLDAVPQEARSQVATAVSRSHFSAEISDKGNEGGVPDAELAAALRERLGQDRQVSAKKIDCSANPQARNYSGQHRLASCRMVSVAMRDGAPLHLILQSRRGSPPIPLGHHWLPYAPLFAACLAVLAYIVARMVTQPLQKLAEAANELGRNIEQPPLAERGPTEVRHAAAAFNAMQAQIRRYVQERTQMLAAITHDLQTPLTRIRLRLEKVQDKELQSRLVEDLLAVQGMIRDGLDLARSLNSGEPMQHTDFDSILDSVCADAVEAGQDVTLSGATGASITAQPSTLRRCLVNLIDNAANYGGYAHVTVSRSKEKLTVRIRDGGAGIPENLLEAVFNPFFRLESSRSRDTGGTGIGLAIARNIAEKHGGRVFLRNHPDGGLEAVLELPTDK